MTKSTAPVGQYTGTDQYPTATPIPGRPTSPTRKKRQLRSVLSSRPVPWFLFLFNLVVAVAVGVGGHHIHVHGQTLHGTQQILTSAGMGAVAIGAGVGLLKRRQRA
jgi:hypothetical protein